MIVSLDIGQRGAGRSIAGGAFPACKRIGHSSSIVRKATNVTANFIVPQRTLKIQGDIISVRWAACNWDHLV